MKSISYTLIAVSCLLASLTGCEKVQLPTDMEEESEKNAAADDEGDEPDIAEPFDVEWGINCNVDFQTGEVTEERVEPNAGGWGEGTWTSPFVVQAFLCGEVWRTLSDEYVSYMTDVWLTGYIVGYVSGRTVKNTVFGAGNVATNIVLSFSPDVRDYRFCVPVQLSSSYPDVREELNLRDNPYLLGSKVKVCGTARKYMSCYGLKSVETYVFE